MHGMSKYNTMTRCYFCSSKPFTNAFSAFTALKSTHNSYIVQFSLSGTYIFKENSLFYDKNVSVLLHEGDVSKLHI